MGIQTQTILTLTTRMKSFAVLPILLQLILISITSTKPVIVSSNEVNDISISSFETAILRCCGSIEDNTGYRCFELNGYGGVNFAKNICKHLDKVLSKIKK